MIEVENLTKRYGPTLAVSDVSFAAQKGEVLGFLGPNGAGKTTTMRVITGYLPPSEGRVRVAGYDVVEEPLESKRRTGYLPETPPIYPDMSVTEYLAFVGRIKGVARRELKSRLDEIAERCAITDVRHRQIGKLSKGYRQRVGLAQALIHNPEVLVLDEPTAGLDPKQIIETRQLIKGLAGLHTVILSTHILPEVEQTCQEVLIINRGHLVATDTVDNLQHRARGGETVLVEVGSANGALDSAALEQQVARVAGVSRVTFQEPRHNHLCAEVESTGNRPIRSDLARAIVEAGWELHELRASAMSLEEIFLQLTREEATGEEAAPQEAHS
jgi:ABC-2 type transport system ATP-binding protein